MTGSSNRRVLLAGCLALFAIFSLAAVSSAQTTHTAVDYLGNTWQCTHNPDGTYDVVVTDGQGRVISRQHLRPGPDPLRGLPLRDPQPIHITSLTLGVGMATIDGLDETELALQVAPTFAVRNLCDLPKPPRWCELRLAIWIARIAGPYPDPWRDLVALGPVVPGPRPDPRDLELGPTWIVAPTIEIVRGGDRWRPSLFLGAGYQHDSARTTVIPELGAFRTTSVSSPVLTYGAAFTYELSSRASLRLEARGLTAFMGTMDVLGPEGEAYVLNGDTMTSAMFSVGASFGF